MVVYERFQFIFSEEPPAAVEDSAQIVTEEGEGTEAATSGGTQIIQIGTGEDKQFIEVPEGYTLIQTPEGLVMSQVSNACFAFLF